MINFNASTIITTGKKGDVVCRPGDWIDVAKFFLFNFVVHAVTVVNAPGAKPLRSMNASLTAILLPFSGAYRAFQSMAFYRWQKEDDLHIALRAQALCTPIPSVHHPTAHVLFPALNVIEVHGQHSVPEYSFLEWTGIKRPALRPAYHLSKVPWWFAITPLKPPSRTLATRSTPTRGQPVDHNPMSETKISCDYNVVKICAAILQILSGLFQIYQSRGTQLVRYGYSTYSLTVVPYVLMSLVNLLVCVCVPQYPMMYIVHYGGKKRPLPQSPHETPLPSRRQSSAENATFTAESSAVELPVSEESTSPAQSSINEVTPLVEPMIEDELHQSSSSTCSAELLRDDSEHFEWEPEATDMVSGVVGVAYGEWDYAKRDTTVPHSATSVSQLAPRCIPHCSHIDRHPSGSASTSLRLWF